MHIYSLMFNVKVLDKVFDTFDTYSQVIPSDNNSRRSACLVNIGGPSGADRYALSMAY